MDYIHSIMIDNGADYVDKPYRPSDRHIYWLVDATNSARSELTFIVRSEMGNLGMATLVANEFRHEQNYKAAFILGIAGTLSPLRDRLGDVVVSSSVKYIGIDKVQALESNEAFGLDEGNASQGTIMIDPRKRALEQSWLRFRRDFVDDRRTSAFLTRYLNDRIPSSLSEWGRR